MQLGLRLEPARGPGEFLVIESVEAEFATAVNDLLGIEPNSSPAGSHVLVAVGDTLYAFAMY